MTFSISVRAPYAGPALIQFCGTGVLLLDDCAWLMVGLCLGYSLSSDRILPALCLTRECAPRFIDLHLFARFRQSLMQI